MIVGTFVSLASPTVVEVVGQCGFDLVCLDAEHAPFGRAAVEDLVRAADVVNCPALVRVPGVGPAIGQALDCGAAGVVVPRVETAAQARAAVDAVRYPPLGSRGAGPSRAAGHGLRFAEHLASANDTAAVIVQVETRRGLENVEEIVAVPGLDMVFVGPGDLSVSLGTPPGSAEHQSAITQIITAARAVDVSVGMFCAAPSDLPRWAEMEVSMFLLSGDLAMLASSASDLSERARDVVVAR